MISGGTLVIQIASRFALILLLISMALVLMRLIKGPQAADRVVALDLISVLIVAFLAIFTVFSGHSSFLDVAIAYALIAFLGTVALSRYLLRSGKQNRWRTKRRKEG
jgi:multicomponent Na+:H+ antiporter subunit F